MPIPEAVIDVMERSLVDVLGVSLLGTTATVTEQVANLVAGRNGRSNVSLLRSRVVAEAERVALLNGIAAHAADFDDVYWPANLHSSAVVAPAVLSVGDAMRSSGRAVLEAFAAGCEAACRTGEWLGVSHYQAGWHSTSTAGVIGAAVGVARLLDLDEARGINALGLAASMSAGLRQNFGSDAKPLHVGRAAAGGVQAALLASSGVTAQPDAVEALGRVAHGSMAHAAFAGIGTGFVVVSPGITQKRHAACGFAQPAIDAILQLDREGLLADEIRTIRIGISPLALNGLSIGRPQTGAAAKFSLGYCAAAAMIDRRAGWRQFTDDAVQRPALQKMAERVVGYPLTDSESTGTARLTVETAEGRIIQARSTETRLTSAEIEGKFIDCATAAVSETEARRVLAEIRVLSARPTVDRLIRALGARPIGRRHAGAW